MFSDASSCSRRLQQETSWRSATSWRHGARGANFEKIEESFDWVIMTTGDEGSYRSFKDGGESGLR
jgi:hypothetical protein